MSRDDVIRMAREAGLEVHERKGQIRIGSAILTGADSTEQVERFARLVAAHAASEAQLDANRYRWIRANSKTGLHYSCSPGWTTSQHMLTGRDLDEAVDRAIRQRGSAD